MEPLQAISMPLRCFWVSSLNFQITCITPSVPEPGLTTVRLFLNNEPYTPNGFTFSYIIGIFWTKFIFSGESPELFWWNQHCTHWDPCGNMPISVASLWSRCGSGSLVQKETAAQGQDSSH